MLPHLEILAPPLSKSHRGAWLILSNFNYCPLIWLLCNKSANKKIDRVHKRALRILYNDYDSSFQSLLRRSNSWTILVKNLQKLMTEIYRSLINVNPSIGLEFHEKNVGNMILEKESLQTFKSKDNIKWSRIRFIQRKLSLEYTR